jgi:hypothetical protein
METFLSVLCFLAIVLAVVTVVGHALWLAAAWFLRVLSGQSAGERRLPPRPCPSCGRLGTVAQGRCRACGAVPAVSPQTTLRQELEATARHLERLLRRGILQPSEHERLIDAIRMDLVRLEESEAALGAGAATAMAQPAMARQARPPEASPGGEVVDAILVEQAPVQPLAGPRAVPPVAPASALTPLAASMPAASPREVHPLDRPEPKTAPPSPPIAPGRTLAEMLQSFLEESNIRVGEIIAGALIVFCAIGLVISLRNTLRQIPYAPALLFMIFTVAFHGAGLYSLRRWKLQAVSRIVLIIALLLVPLGFSAGVVLGERRFEIANPLFYVAVLVGALAFGWVTVSAARETVGAAWWRLSAGVLGASLAQVLISRVARDSAVELTLATTSLLAALPLGCFLIAGGGQVVAAGGKPRLNRRRIAQSLVVLGAAFFALAVPLALLVHLSGERLVELAQRASPDEARALLASAWSRRYETLAQLTPTLSVAAAAVLAMGLTIHKLTLSRSLAVYRLAGTSAAVFGGITMLAMVALAWPQPELLVAVGASNAVLLLALAWTGSVAPLYAAALASAALASVVVTHLAAGKLALDGVTSHQLVTALLTCRSGLVLTALAAGAGTAGWRLLRGGRRDEGWMFLASAASLSLLSALTAAFVGFVPAGIWHIESQHDALWAAPLLIFHALVLLALAPAARHPATALVGAGLLWLGLVHAFAWNSSVRHVLESVHLMPARPVLTATLVHAVVTALVALAAGWRGALASEHDRLSALRGVQWPSLVLPLSLASAAALAGALPFILWVQPAQLYWHAAYAFWGAIVCTTLVFIWRHQAAFASLQALAALAAAFLAAAICRQQLGAEAWLWDWRHLDAQLATTALAAGAWSALRRTSHRWPTVRGVVAAAELSVDQALLGMALLVAVFLAIAAVWPGAAVELGFATGATDAVGWTASAGGIGDWLALAAIVAGLAMLAVEGRVRDAVAGLVAALFAVPWLAAGWFAPQVAVASGARWLLSAYVALVAASSLAVARWGRRVPHLGQELAKPSTALAAFGLGGAAILILTMAAVTQAVRGASFGGPLRGSWFDWLGPTVSFGTPLVVLVGVSLAFSIAWRQPALSVAASLLFQLAANLAFLVHLSGAQLPAEVRWAEWLAWNSLALGMFGAIWSAVELWKQRRAAEAAPTDGNRELAAERLGIGAQIVLCGITVVALAVWALGAVVIEPGRQFAVTAQLGAWTSFAAAGLWFALLQWRWRGGLPRAADWLVATTAMVAMFCAARGDASDPQRQWYAYHALGVMLLLLGVLAAEGHMVGTMAIKWPGLLSGSLADLSRVPPRWLPSHFSALALLVAALVLAIRGGLADPGRPWWTAGIALGAAAVLNQLGLEKRSQGYGYLGVAAAVAPPLLYMLAPVAILGVRNEIAGEACTLVPLAVAGIWAAAEIRVQRREDRSLDLHWLLPTVHRLAGVLGLASLAILVAGRLLAGLLGGLDSPALPLWAMHTALAVTLATLFVLLLVSLWDRRAVETLPGLYVCGLVAIGFGLHLLRWAPWPAGALIPAETYAQVLAAGSLMSIAAYVAFSGELWNRGALLSVVAARLGVSDPVGGLSRAVLWLPSVSLALELGISAASFFGANCLSRPLTGASALSAGIELRTLAALAPAIAAWGIARQAQQARQNAFQILALGFAGLSAVYLGWAQLPSVLVEPLWMTRTFRLLMVLSVLTFVYGLALPRLLFTEGTWHLSARRAGYAAAVLSVATFIAILCLEVAMFEPHVGNGVEAVQVVAVAVVLLALVAGLVSLALFPGRDPLGLSEKGRMGYVYAAEATVSLLFVHLYLCRPMWFDTVLRPYWPYILMGIAFAGVAAGEVLTRWRVRILAEPLRHTGTLMPLLPAIAMWVLSSRSDYALLLFLAGLMYLAIALTQRSWVAAAAAGLAGNGALWTVLARRPDWNFTDNPQFWLIPPAVSVLAAAQVNRRQLDPKLLAAIRYGASIVIYLSSTSEIFLRGIGHTLWPPMLLLGLSLAGVLVGIMLRIRAFLYLGSGFTLMALVTMVWHAARAIDEVWPWWAFGIVLGIALLVLFALFEKKRSEVEALAARLRQWEQ